MECWVALCYMTGVLGYIVGSVTLHDGSVGLNGRVFGYMVGIV